MMGSDSYTRLFAVLYFTATRENTKRRDIVAYLNEKFGGNVSYEGQITKYAKDLREKFFIRLTWSTRSGYKIRTWGFLDKDKFLKRMAEQLGEELPADLDKIKAPVIQFDIKKKNKKRLSTKSVNKS